MSNILWDKTLYRAPIDFLLDTNIVEYDISKANINVLRDANIISEDQYQYLLQASSNERYITIGKMQGANPKVTEALKNGIKQAKKIFMELNCIDDNDILSIRNDSITVLNNKHINKFDITERVRFREVGRYTSFYKLINADVLYLYNHIDNIEAMEVKGISNEALATHENYMKDFLLELFYRAQIEGVTSAIQLISNFTNQYRLRTLELNYYREFNSESRFRIIPSISSVFTYTTDIIPEYYRNFIDISYNENILRLITQYYSSIYFGRK